ncbi:hypothetical protein ACFST9_14335 [Hymenobacter monticola]|uniref:DUF3078 domain-containing protein n=1 Tax=Hymenobacter monticola TaxID=1705399 RepID=A0ABY4BC44_9BACT|nr:hypothetical protein [Hymenobacter monticola]UOE36708.1 hypothetical protein MTP16_24785 [Hymenobacter monticola]
MKHLFYCFLFVLSLSRAFGQTSQGFSAQLQPVITFQTSYIRETLRDSLVRGLLPVDQNKKLLLALSPKILIQPTEDLTKDVTLPLGQVDIAADVRLLAAYDSVVPEWETNKELVWWLPQVIADGDFNKLTGSNGQASPKAGTIGLDAVRMKAIYRKYTYTGKVDGTEQQLPVLVGRRNVFVPTFTFTGLFTLFGEGAALTSGVKAGAAKSERASRDISRNFAQTLLAPGGLSQNGSSGLISCSFLPFAAYGHGLHQLSIDGTLLYSTTNWSTRDSATTVNILAPSVGLSYRVFDGYHTSKASQPQIRLFARYALRHLFGDVQHQPRLLLDVFNSIERTFHGAEFGATASISAVRVTVSGGLFNGGIEGFSNGQMLLGLGLAAGIRL